MTLSCWNCGAGLGAIALPIGRHANCPACYAQLHCCKLCQHYDAKRPAQCTEDRAEPPNNKEVANFCDWFAPQGGAGNAVKHDHVAAAARAKLDALFASPGTSEVSRTTSTAPALPTADAPSSMSPAQRAAAELERLFPKTKPKPGSP